MQKFKKIISIVILLVLIPILFMSMVILINSYTHPNKIPSFFGWKPFIVLSGSMETQISVGDVVIVKEVDTKITKVSMRSKKADVAKVCMAFGGGGHTFAAGCTIKANIKESIAQLLKEIKL